MEDTMGYPKMIQNGHSNGDDGVIDHGILRSSFRQTDGTIISAAWTIQTSPSNSRSTPTTGRSILNLRDHREAFCLTWQPEILVDILRILTLYFHCISYNYNFHLYIGVSHGIPLLPSELHNYACIRFPFGMPESSMYYNVLQPTRPTIPGKFNGCSNHQSTAWNHKKDQHASLAQSSLLGASTDTHLPVWVPAAHRPWKLDQ